MRYLERRIDYLLKKADKYREDMEEKYSDNIYGVPIEVFQRWSHQMSIVSELCVVYTKIQGEKAL